MTKKKSPSEKEIQRECLDLLCLYKIHHARINSGDMFTGKYRIRLAPTGFPDLLVFLHGVHGVEVKREGESPTPHQEVWRSIFERHAAGYIVVHSAAELNDYLKELRRKGKG